MSARQIDPTPHPFFRDPGNALATFVRDSTADGETVYVFGEIDLSNVAEMEAAIHDLLPYDGSVSVDLSGCTYLDSTGLRAIIRTYDAFSGRLQLTIPRDGSIARIFQISGLMERLQIAG